MKNTLKLYQIRILFLGVFGLSLLLSGCGFQPIYGNIATDVGNQSIEKQLRRVDIGVIPNQEGQYLRNQLIDRLHNTGAVNPSLYLLTASEISENRKDLDITKESDSTIAQLRLSTTVTLKRESDGQTLLNKNVWSTVSYNILESQFTTRVSRNDARKNALNDLAQQIERQVALSLKTQQK